MKTLIHKPCMVCLVILIVCCCLNAAGQTAVTSFSTAYVSSGSSVSGYSTTPATGAGSFSSCSATTHTYSFSNGSSNQLKLTGFNAGGLSYLPGAASATVKLRRVNNSNVTGSRSIVFLEATGTVANCPSPATLAFKPPYNDVMESFLDNNIINQGTDNIFTNASNGDGNQNNIERVDVIFPAGLSTASTTNAGFIILDRGSNYSHDGFRIVAITSLDGSGDPASFGSVKSCTAGNGSSTNGSWGHPSTANGNKQLQVYVLRKDPAADTYLRVSTSINQEFGGVFFSFASLGVAANQKIYGYSLIGPDGVANPSSSQLLSTSDATVYPTTTTEAAGGGLDLLTVNSVFVTGSSVILPVQFISFAGGDKDGHALLNWQLDLTDGNKTLALERSEDGSHFYPLYQSAIAHGHQTMTYTDQPGPGIHYYRLKIAETLTAGISFSQTLSVGIDAAAGWRIYPTMAGRGEALHIQGMPDGMYTLCFTNLYGVSLRQPLWVKNHEAGIMLPSCLGPGMHLLTLDNGKGPLKTARVVVR